MEKKNTTPDQIVIVSDLGHDDQGEYSDIKFCAVRIERAAISKLKEIITFVRESRKAFDGGIQSIDFDPPAGADVRFFNLSVDNADPDADYTARIRMAAKLERLFARKSTIDWPRQTIVRRRAQEVWDFADEAQSELEWTLSGSSMTVWASDEELWLSSDYKNTRGRVESPALSLPQIEGYFAERIRIVPSGAGLMFDDLNNDYLDGKPIWREVGKQDYLYALRAVQPLDVTVNDFLMGEPYTHTENDVIYSAFIRIGVDYGETAWERFFARHIGRSQFKAAATELRDYIFRPRK